MPEAVPAPAEIACTTGVKRSAYFTAGFSDPLAGSLPSKVGDEAAAETDELLIWAVENRSKLAAAENVP